MSGNCATGMRVSAINPAIVMTNAMTTARRGRSTKIAEITGLPPGRRWWRARRPGRDDLTRADTLHALGNNQLAFVEAARHDRRLRCRLAEMDAPHLRPVLPIDDIDVVALLVRQDRRARDAEHRDRLHPFQQ